MRPMHILHSIKVYLAIFFALLYVLSPLKNEILEISHKIAHKIEATSNRHHHKPPGHIAANTHSHPHPHPHENVEHSAHSVAHEHEFLEFVSTILKVPDQKKSLLIFLSRIIMTSIWFSIFLNFMQITKLPKRQIQHIF